MYYLLRLGEKNKSLSYEVERVGAHETQAAQYRPAQTWGAAEEQE